MFTSANPFAVLDNRRFKGDPTKLTQPKDNIVNKKKADAPSEGKPKEKAAKKADAAPVVEEPVRKSKVLKLKEEPVPEPVVEAPKAVADPPAPTKKEREVKDRHEDRSAKGDRERKGGVGKGGWAEGLTKEQEQAEHEVRGDASPQSDDEKREEKRDAAATQEAAPEPEKPTFTLQEYLEKQKDKQLAPTVFKERQVDKSAFKNMVQATKTEEQYLSLKKPTAKPAPKAAAKPAAKKVEEKKEKKPEEKVEVGFYLEQNQGRGRGRRGRGRSDDAGEEQTEGGDTGYRGRGRGRGRGGYHAHAQAHAEEKDNSFVLKNDDFPELPSNKPQ